MRITGKQLRQVIREEIIRSNKHCIQESVEPVTIDDIRLVAKVDSSQQVVIKEYLSSVERAGKVIASLHSYLTSALPDHTPFNRNAAIDSFKLLRDNGAAVTPTIKDSLVNTLDNIKTLNVETKVLALVAALITRNEMGTEISSISYDFNDILGLDLVVNATQIAGINRIPNVDSFTSYIKTMLATDIANVVQSAIENIPASVTAVPEEMEVIQTPWANYVSGDNKKQAVQDAWIMYIDVIKPPRHTKDFKSFVAWYKSRVAGLKSAGKEPVMHPTSIVALLNAYVNLGTDTEV